MIVGVRRLSLPVRFQPVTIVRDNRDVPWSANWGVLAFELDPEEREIPADITDFVTLGILVETTGRARDRKFRYAPYVALFPQT